MYFVKDDVVISGIGGTFPKAQNIREFQERLLNNEWCMESRWKAGERGVTNVIGKVETELFDSGYFGIHRQQCTFMDPMHRLVLERTFEALIDAGVNPLEVRGRRIGCFMASSVGENDNLFLESVVSGFGVTGHSRAMMPNRVSYWLDLKGPSVAYDSNWVGGIEVLKLAFEAIKTGQCEACVVGTANLALNSEFQWLYHDMGLISPDGETRAFDINAQGYGRSDGVVVMYIQKYSEAKRCYASIMNVDTIFDGCRPGTLLDINSDNMAEFIEEVRAKADIDINDIQYVETYGCGLKETDRKEVEALDKVYCKNRAEPLLIGAVKPNVGHSEASSALFSVAKVLVAMEAGIIPATIRLDTINPELTALVDGKMKVVQENLNWTPKYAAVNAIGIDSYYGHIILKANQKQKSLLEVTDEIPRLVLASTRTEAGIAEILKTIKSKPKLDIEYVKLVQDLYSYAIPGHLYRGYSILGSEAPKEESEYFAGNKRQIWFVYTGMGSQWPGMISDFMKIPVFASAINKCQEILATRGLNLIEIISNPDPKTYDNILHSFVGIAALQIGLTDVVKALGIVPDGIIGHSVGELGCAYADGCMTAEQMILAAYSRGMASLESDLIPGMMAAVGLGYQQMKDKVPPMIEIACHNGPDSCTISGPTADMEQFVKELQDEGLFARLVNVSNIAYHSRYIQPAGPTLLKYLKNVLPEKMPRSEKWISTSNKEENWDTDLAKYSSPEYHTNNLLSSVLFEEGLAHVPKDAILIEIAPHGLLQAILKRSVKPGCTNVALTQRGAQSGVEFLLASLGKLYLAGLDMNLTKIYPSIDYPVGRGTSSLADLTHWEHGETWRTGLEEKLKTLFGVRDFQVTLNSEEFRNCTGHQIDDKFILPCSSYLNTIYDVVAKIGTGQKEILIENLHFRNVIAVPKIGSVAVHAMIQKGTGEFEIMAGTNIIVTGNLTSPGPNDDVHIEAIPVAVTKNDVSLSSTDVYQEFCHRGCKFTGDYQLIQKITLTEQGSLARIQYKNKWALLVEAMLQQHLLHAGEKDQDIFTPKNITKILINLDLLPEENSSVLSHYDFATGLISAPGIQIIGVKTTAFVRDPKSISFDAIDFVPLSKPDFPRIENGINLALQLTLENAEDKLFSVCNIFEIASSRPLADHVKNVCNQYPNLNCSFTVVEDAKGVQVQGSSPVLVLINDGIPDDIVKTVAGSNAFLLAKMTKSLLSYPDLVQVLDFTVNTTTYTLLRRAKTTLPVTVAFTGKSITAGDLSRRSSSWIQEFEAGLDLAHEKKTRLYFQIPVLPDEGIPAFVQQLAAVPKMESVKIIFTLSQKPLPANQLQKIYKLDLVSTVYKDGTWGVIVPSPLKLAESIERNVNITSNAVENKLINYIGVNQKDETLLDNAVKKNELGILDFSGVSTNGQQVMGLAKIDKYGCKFVTDPAFVWNVPKGWSLEEAATAPYAYACAYYLLLVKGKLERGETVLIHTGCSALGLAAISIAFQHKCEVFTTVSTKEQRTYLKKVFPLIKEENIFSSDNHSFEPYLLKVTEGLGAHVIINNLSGSLVQSSVNCLADFGRLLQIGKHDVEENNSFGMSVFLKNTSFSVVDLNNIFIQHKEVKQHVYNLVEEGLKTGVVRPIAREVVTHQRVAELLDSLSRASNIGKILIKVDNNLALNKFHLNNPSQYICNSTASYLIYGGTADNWTDMIEWLILRGARKIVISSDFKPTSMHINRRLALLQTYFDVNIISIPPKAHLDHGAVDLLNEVSLLGAIQIIFLLPGKFPELDAKTTLNLGQALQSLSPKPVFINLGAKVSGVSHTDYNIHWQDDLDFAEATFGLDEILTYKIKDILIKNDKISNVTQETPQILIRKLVQMLPTSLDDYEEFLSDQPEEPQLLQLITLGPRTMRELAPVFIIPGLTGQKELRDMAFELIYPTFLAVLPSKPKSIQDLAQDISKEILKIWPKGVYNIIGVSWGGALMIEVARILEQQGGSLHLFFVDAAPSTIQSSAKHLGQDNTTIETNLLTRLFKITDHKVAKEILKASDWESRFGLAVKNYSGQVANPEILATGLYTLKFHLENLLAYEPTDSLVSGKVHLIRPQGVSQYDDCDLVSFCKETPQITTVNGDHLSILTCQDTAEYINEHHYLV